MFRVVADQLKISEGWVRCGHCAEVFDASAHLSDESILDLPEPEPAVTPPAPAPQPPSEQPTRPVELHTRPAELYQTRSAERSSDSSSFFGVESEDLEPSPLDAPFVFRRSDLALPDRDSTVQPPAPSGFIPLDDDDELAPAELDDVSFVRQARRKAFWRRPFVRIGLALASLALAAVLLLQVAYQDRDRLALAQPTLRPALARMCELLECTLGAPRQIEAIVIESSGFNRLRNDTYRLAFTLRNAAAVPVAVPAIELTVTDSQDQPIARRVLLPQELEAADGAIAPGAEWPRAAGIVLSAPAPARVAGYRLLAFYP
jgi:predicted Zn finger-like uncharacterized protein